MENCIGGVDEHVACIHAFEVMQLFGEPNIVVIDFLSVYQQNSIFSHQSIMLLVAVAPSLPESDVA